MFGPFPWPADAPELDASARFAGPAPLTAVVLAANQARAIEACLASVRGWAAELLVVDMGSQDETAALAGRHADRVLALPRGTTVDDARRAGARHTTQDWLLYLGADEQVPPGLAACVTALLAQPPPGMNGVQLPRRNL